ncbi:hypothetical protein C8R44DRAFT_742767 [Mycena epipterygia]|nr:hypothetical protein C8R44DRAFT_742767 [Mycena epipterygia]
MNKELLLRAVNLYIRVEEEQGWTEMMEALQENMDKDGGGYGYNASLCIHPGSGVLLFCRDIWHSSNRDMSRRSTIFTSIQLHLSIISGAPRANPISAPQLTQQDSPPYSLRLRRGGGDDDDKVVLELQRVWIHDVKKRITVATSPSEGSIDRTGYSSLRAPCTTIFMNSRLTIPSASPTLLLSHLRIGA